jgi:two-component system alkaline phosphatase synthesis response regulator PhoP
MSARVLVVDDDRQIVRLLRTYLEQAGVQVLVAYEGETAWHVIRRERPDLVVLDLMLPGRDGWDIIRHVRADAGLSATPVLMLTARVEDGDKIQGFELGADDYVTKPFNPTEVVARVLAILRRATAPAHPPAVLVQHRLRLDRDQHTVTLNDRPIDVTPTEFALLRALLEKPGHAFTRDELIEAAFGYRYEGLDRTIDSHVKNLRKKIEPDPAHPVYIETVFGVGYRLRTDQDGRR